MLQLASLESVKNNKDHRTPAGLHERLDRMKDRYKLFGHASLQHVNIDDRRNNGISGGDTVKRVHQGSCFSLTEGCMPNGTERFGLVSSAKVWLSH